MVRILVVDDDPEITDLLKLDLELMRFDVHTAADGAAAVKKVTETAYDLMIIDVMMPRMDGYEACQKIRHLPNGKELPIIMLTAKGTLADKVRGFNAGVDDYLVKPFEFQELMVRMRALFRRTGALNREAGKGTQNPIEADVLPKTPERLEAGDIRLLPTSLEVCVNDERIKLTPTEFEILYCLMQNANEPVRLATLLKDVWGYDADEDVRMLRVHMGGLRQKIEDDAKKPIYVETVTNVGYRLNPYQQASPQDDTVTPSMDAPSPEPAAQR